MAQQATPPDTRKVMRKLKIHECTVNGLFNLPCPPSTIIKEKLAELNDLVVDIPDGLGEAVFDEWNVKLARWWAQYAECIDKCQQNEPTQVYGSNHSNSGSLISDFGEQQKKITICYENKLSKPSSDTKHQIEQEFAVLPVISSTDIDGMKCLLTHISQSLKLFASLFDDKVNKYKFYNDLFTVVFSKLSTELGEHYLQVAKSAISPFSRFQGLRQFIANRIVKIHNQNSGLCAENSIDTIGEQMKHEFSELPKVDIENCIDQVKCILTCVSKARVHLRPFRNNDSFNQLQSNLFDLAFSKSSPILEQECDKVDPIIKEPKQLATLQKVLSKYIVDYYAKQKATQAEQIKQIQSVVRECASNGGDAKLCYYCYSVGHFTAQCDHLKSMICYNCLKTGHKASNCTASAFDRTHQLFCFECVQFGHFAGYCPTAVCSRCKQSGHIVRQCAN